MKLIHGKGLTPPGGRVAALPGRPLNYKDAYLLQTFLSWQKVDSQPASTWEVRDSGKVRSPYAGNRVEVKVNEIKLPMAERADDIPGGLKVLGQPLSNFPELKLAKFLKASSDFVTPCRLTYNLKPAGVVLKLSQFMGYFALMHFFLTLDESFNVKGVRTREEILHDLNTSQKGLMLPLLLCEDWNSDAQNDASACYKTFKYLADDVGGLYIHSKENQPMAHVILKPHVMFKEQYAEARLKMPFLFTQDVREKIVSEGRKDWVGYLLDLILEYRTKEEQTDKTLPQTEPLPPAEAQTEPKMSHTQANLADEAKSRLSSRKLRVKIAPPPFLNNLRPAEILALVEKQGIYTCELDGPPGDILVTPRIAPVPPKGRKLGPREKVEKEQPIIDLEEAAVRSSLAVMEERFFRNIVQNRRYAAEWEWKQTHKRPLHMEIGTMEYIIPDRLGEVPALVIGLHISGKGERLYPVCVEFPPEVEGEEPKRLIFFPSGWLNYKTNLTFLHGKRYDPTLKDFGVVLPPHWKDEYRKVHVSEDDIAMLFS